MRRIFYTGLILLFSLALSISTVGWLKGRQELEAVTVANETLRKTLGDMTVAIAQKDREIDRLTQSACGTDESRESQRTGTALKKD
ncbi:MAG: hypothetical protein ABSB35_30555 [Bryobacteraceae bacterium]